MFGRLATSLQWRENAFVRLISAGLPMDFSSYAKMTNADLEAIVTYLRTVPPLE